MTPIILDVQGITLTDCAAALAGPIQLQLTAAVRERVAAGRKVVDACLHDGQPHYGINTGLGMLARKSISNTDLAQLQINILRSHAAGVGAALSPELSRLLFFLKIVSFCSGHSGVRLELLDHAITLLNHNVIPVIPCQGSVGASGDLIPLAHLSLPLIGEGEVWWQGQAVPAAQVLTQLKIQPIALAPKEGLALINGTQAMTAQLAANVLRAQNLVLHANAAAALTLEALFGSVKPLDPRIHDVRPHAGQIAVAAQLRGWLKDSDVIASHAQCQRVQDPYSLRCVPQVHGPVTETLDWVSRIVSVELNSCTDNPLVFVDDGQVLSGGNFHGQNLAFAADFLAIAMHELGSLSERRIEQLTNPKAGELPTLFLTQNPGLESGFMLPHVAAASLVAENRTLTTPASTDSISTSAGQEDHVSMGWWAARKCALLLDNLTSILAIELLASTKALSLHTTPLQLGQGTRRVQAALAPHLQRMQGDVSLAPLIAAVRQQIADQSLVAGLL